MVATTTTHEIRLQPAGDLDGIDDGSIALVITSPPYPMIEMWDNCFSAQDPAIEAALGVGDGGRAFDLMHDMLLETWTGLHRVLVDGGIACINIGDATRTIGNRFELFMNHAKVIELCRGAGFNSLPGITWRKPTNAPNKFMGSGMLPPGAYITLEQEHVLVFRKGGKREFHSDVDKERRRASAYFWEERNKWFSDTWDVRGALQGMAGEATTRVRSAAFPFELAARLVHMFSIKGDVVLDPFAGTGTTMIAAMAGARHCIGYEREASLAGIIESVVSRAAETCNAWNAGRLASHDAFIKQYTVVKGAPKHVNNHHDVPVITSQETGLRLDVVHAIEGRLPCFTVIHEPWPRAATYNGPRAW